MTLKKYIVSKVESSTRNEKRGNTLKFEDFIYEEEFNIDCYGMFDTLEQARECFEEYKYFWHRCYRTVCKDYECHVEYVKIEEVEWDTEENEISEYGDIWETSFEDFEVKD